MANTGLREALESIYAKNSVDHMMSGKAISRALWGHFIVDAVLAGLLLAQKKILSLEPSQRTEHLPSITEDKGSVQRNELLCKSEVVGRYENAKALQKESLQGSRTAKL